MLDTVPREPEWRSWLYVVAWSLVIFFTIPFARAFRQAVAERMDLQFFIYITIVLAVVGGGIAFTNLRKRGLPAGAYVWLSGVTATFVAYTYYLRDIPEEAIHMLQYGLLGFLVYRALVHHVKDYSIYFLATLIVGIIGIIDEYIQWIVPSRFFGVRDILTNSVAGGLAQVAIAGGLRPTIIRHRPPTTSWRRLCNAIALALFLLGLSYVNTPERVAWYAARVPFLSFLLDSKSMMGEYGYRYHDPEIGTFRSRFSPEQLEAHDIERGVDVARILDQYFGGKGYGAFHKTYTVPRDAYTHEAGVHLFRRDQYLKLATSEEINRAYYFTVAIRENQILEKYFPTAMENSKNGWTQEIRTYADDNALKAHEYVSPVSRTLITQFSERQVLLAFVVAIVFFLLLGAYLRSGEHDKIRAPKGLQP